MAYKLTDKLRFFLIYPDETEYQVYIKNNSIVLKDQINDFYGFSQRTIENELLIGNDANTNFQKLYSYEKNNDNCFDIGFRVEIYENDAWETFWDGVIPFRSGSWDLDHCIAELKPDPNDSYRWILENETKEKNLFSIADRYSINAIEGDVEYIEVSVENQAIIGIADYTLPTPPIGKAWSLIYSEVNTYETIIYNNPDDLSDVSLFVTKVTILQRYCRQVATGAVNVNDGWVVDGSKTVRILALTTPVTSVTTERIVSGDSTVVNIRADNNITKKVVSSEIVDYEADNLLSLPDIFEYLLADCGLPIVSDFFNINPDATAPDNVAYDYANDYFQEVLVSQASDIVNANALQNATKFNIDFKTFWENISALTNVELFELDGKLRIEHISYRESRKTLDISTNALIKGKNKYKYNNSSYPSREIFTFKYATGSDDFDNAKIEYEARCSNGKDKDYAAPNVVNNVSDLYNNSVLQEDKSKMKDTFVLLSTDNGRLVSGIGAITGLSVLNAPFAFANLIESLRLHKRPQKTGIINGKNVEFISKKELREQSPIEIKMCLSEYHQNFSILDSVKTGLGWGVLEEAKYTIPFDKLEFTPLHE